MITLQVQNLKKTFGVKTVFSGINFSHSAGLLGIAGPNGSGKSTLLKCLAGLLRPTNGSIHWTENNSELTTEALKSKLGFAAPYINLYDELSCRENLEFLTKVRHQPTNNTGSIAKWLTKVGLNEFADQPFGKLSTGQQQRLRVASALFHEPRVLMLDEPGSNLDKAGHALIKDIADHFRETDKLLILASNNTDELLLCDRIFSVEDEEFASSLRR